MSDKKSPSKQPQQPQQPSRPNSQTTDKSIEKAGNGNFGGGIGKTTTSTGPKGPVSGKK